MSPRAIARLVGGAILLFVVVVVAASGTFVIQPGFRGVKVTLGEVSPTFEPEGFGLKSPLITEIHPVSVRQQTREDKAACYSADLQQIQVDLRVLFRIPEASVVPLFRDYLGDPFDSLVAPRVHEALKEVAALQSAEQIVKNREQIKTSTLETTRRKIGTFLVIEDIVIQDIALTPQLERAIEAKMVQEQEAAKSRYMQQRAQIDADTAVIKAGGEAESIRIRGEALRNNPTFIDLQVVDKWDGLTPLVVGAGTVLLGAQDLERLGPARVQPPAAAPAPAPAGRR